MERKIAHVALVVRDYDEAIEFYTRAMGFVLTEDTVLDDEKRWVTVSPSEQSGCSLLLAKAKNDHQMSRIGNQTGGRVFLFLHTDDFWRDFNRLKENQVKVVRQPSTEAWGTVAVFEDLYGNLWDLIEK
jgi:catechol 2,3-dioxygenase-like lactoylglutathione lyase family enzyme